MTLAEHIEELRQEVRGALTRRERNAVRAELAKAIAARRRSSAPPRRMSRARGADHMPKVLNARQAGTKSAADRVYVGRPSRWGNPFVLGRDGVTRTFSCEGRNIVKRSPSLTAGVTISQPSQVRFSDNCDFLLASLSRGTKAPQVLAMRPLGLEVFLGFMAIPAGAAVAADTCPQPGSEIATDRPDVTNSSLVVPQGSFQQENGVNINGRDGGQVLDGTNTRLRFGVAPCFEVLFDVPTYFDAMSGRAGSGFTNVVPAIKWQISPLPGKVDLSATFGAGLPTGTKAIAGPGVQPYLQFPWSWELGGGWSLNGMLTNFAVPANPINKLSTETTFVIEREIGKRAFLFVEYVGDYHVHGGPSYLFNSGGGYRITDTQQIDFHIAIGLNDNAPAYIFGVGYSFRFDRLF
jgi:hypothetical protein